MCQVLHFPLICRIKCLTEQFYVFEVEFAIRQLHCAGNEVSLLDCNSSYVVLIPTLVFIRVPCIFAEFVGFWGATARLTISVSHCPIMSCHIAMS